MHNQQSERLTAFYLLAPMEILILFMAIIISFIISFVISYRKSVKVDQIWVLIILDCGLTIGGQVIEDKLR